MDFEKIKKESKQQRINQQQQLIQMRKQLIEAILDKHLPSTKN